MVFGGMQTVQGSEVLGFFQSIAATNSPLEQHLKEDPKSLAGCK
jgi:hypothetical protein